MCHGKEQSLEEKVKAGNSLRKDRNVSRETPISIQPWQQGHRLRWAIEKSKASTVPKAMIKLIAADSLYEQPIMIFYSKKNSPL